MKVYKGGKISSHKEDAEPNLLRLIQQCQEEEIMTPTESEAKYAAMLLELIKPYHGPKPDATKLDRLMDLATIAWNIANMKKEMPFAYQMMLQEAEENLKEDEEGIQLLLKLIREKEKKFNAFDLFIQDYSFTTSENGELIAKVGTTALETFLTNDIMDKEEDEEGYNFEPAYINRNAFTVRPREPFFKWIKEVGTDSLFPIAGPEPNIYLIEERDSLKEIEGWIERNYERIFLKELEAWYTDKKLWPQNRTYKMFREWFTVSCYSMVYDLENFPVNKDLP